MLKNVLVTGTSSGIGQGIAKHLTQLGYQVFSIDQNTAEINKIFFQGDVSDESFLEKVCKKTPPNFCGLINCAAIQLEKKFYETSSTEWKRVFDVNVLGYFLVSKIFLSKLGFGASIINISSVHSKATSKGMCAYAASKSAISGMTRAMALELGEKNIRVNAIVPGAIDTPMLKRGLSRNDSMENSLKKLTNSSPLHKIGKTDDIAKLCAFLLDSELSGNITGSEFTCDSGVLAKLASE